MLVMWSCLIQLLSKCPSEGCSSAVTEDNIETCEDGKIASKLYPASSNGGFSRGRHTCEVPL